MLTTLLLFLFNCVWISWGSQTQSVSNSLDSTLSTYNQILFNLPVVIEYPKDSNASYSVNVACSGIATVFPCSVCAESHKFWLKDYSFKYSSISNIITALPVCCQYRHLWIAKYNRCIIMFTSMVIPSILQHFWCHVLSIIKWQQIWCWWSTIFHLQSLPFPSWLVLYVKCDKFLIFKLNKSHRQMIWTHWSHSWLDIETNCHRVNIHGEYLSVNLSHLISFQKSAVPPIILMIIIYWWWWWTRGVIREEIPNSKTMEIKICSIEIPDVASGHWRNNVHFTAKMYHSFTWSSRYGQDARH